MERFKNTLIYLICISLWFVLLCSGYVVGTKYYREQVAGHEGTITNVTWLLWCWIVVLLNYSLTNIGMLCCIASVIGGLTHQQKRENVPKLLARGMFVYMSFMTGMVMVDAINIAEVTQEKYVRIAMLLSFFSYVIGYNPDLFERLMAKSKERVADGIDSGRFDPATNHADVAPTDAHPPAPAKTVVPVLTPPVLPPAANPATAPASKPPAAGTPSAPPAK